MRKRNIYTIAVDFDGTICKHDDDLVIREDVPGAMDTLKKLLANNHKLILYTMRSGAYLREAVEYCKAHGITFYAVNSNPTQNRWTSSPKVYAHAYIDDAAIGCPLVYPPNPNERAYADWSMIEKRLENMQLL